MSEQKLSIKERFGLLRYSLGLVRRLTPGFLPLILSRAFFTACQPLVVLFFSAQILNQLDGQRHVPTMMIYVSMTIGITFIFSLLKSLADREVESQAGHLQANASILHLEAERFITMDFAYTEDSALGERLALMDVRARGNGLGLISFYFRLEYLIQVFFSVVFSFILLSGPLSGGGIGLSGTPALIMAVFFAFGLFVTFKLRGVEKRLLDKTFKDNAKANTSLPFYRKYMHIDGAAKEIRLFRQAGMMSKLIEECFSTSLWVRFFLRFGALGGVSTAFLAAVSGGFYLITGSAALGGSVPVGSIVQSVGAATICATSIGSLVALLGRIYNEVEYLQPMRDYLTLPDRLTKGSRSVNNTPGHLHRLEFNNVSFRYPGAGGFALENLTLTLHAGQRLAVVGLNGSGKTTMIKLLCRLYDPDEGEILLDGVNIKEYDYGQYLDLFSVVFQDFMLLPLELGKNVAGGETYNEAQARDCLIRAGFGERLNTMPNGLDTMLYRSYDENGTQVSGGEAQKIALARALYKNAPIVVLDEPTAALDPIAEYEVYTTFDKTIGDKTAVFISHRLSSCRFCHHIAVFEGGKLIQYGSHEELLAIEGGRYRQLWDAQAGHYSADRNNTDRAEQNINEMK